MSGFKPTLFLFSFSFFVYILSYVIEQEIHCVLLFINIVYVCVHTCHHSLYMYAHMSEVSVTKEQISQHWD